MIVPPFAREAERTPGAHVYMVEDTQRLANRIMEAWRTAGHLLVQAWAVPVGSGWVVRSNLINGLPPRRI